MQPIQINVSVNIGVNKDLYGLVSALLSLPRVEAKPEATEEAAPEPVTPAPKRQRMPKQQPTEAPEEAKEETAEPCPEPVEDAAPAKVSEKKYTEVDVRAAMDRTRMRIEGENYKEQTDSEGYKKWHRVLTGWFKNTAATFGAEKPSALPDSESRAKFIACCDALEVKGDELVENCPF